MKAMVHHEYGSPEVLRLEGVGPLAPGENEVLVRVRAVGLNWADYSVVGRTYPLVETPAALDYVGQRHSRGKTVVTL